MQTQADINETATALLSSKGLSLITCKPIQTLWAGYGHICRIQATNSQNQPSSLILKYISPPASKRKRDEGYLRKVISYQVEQYFYTHLAPHLPPGIAVPVCIASSRDLEHVGSATTAMVLTDLRDGFPVAGEKRGVLNSRQVDAAIDWLAGFHGFWWARSQELLSKGGRRPPLEEPSLAVAPGVWLNGGYTYLATRRSEYTNLVNDDTSEWSAKLCTTLHPNNVSIAELVGNFLTPSSTRDTYTTLIHGDVKSENLFTTNSGDAVAFFDFQYVGLGLGVCDLAKLFTCSLPEETLHDGARDGKIHAREEGILRRYLERLEAISGNRYPWDVFVRHWEIALVDWLRFQASWGFWGNTEWLEARGRSILEDDEWKRWLDDNVD